MKGQDMKFRELNTEERKLRDKLLSRGKTTRRGTLSVRYFRNGNFTVSVVKTTRNIEPLIGVAKRNSKDEENPKIGELVAFSRAILKR